MFNPRDYIGMPFESAKNVLQNMGYIVTEMESTADDRHAYDSKLVVRVDVCNECITLVTAKFLMKI